MNTEKIRPIHLELQGYLAQAPEGNNGHIYQKGIWEDVNDAIDKLNTLLNTNDYTKFKIVPESNQFNDQRSVDILVFKTKLGGLINSIYGQFFFKEGASPILASSPSSSSINTSIQMNQNQNQTMHIQMLLEISTLLDKKINEVKKVEEKSFIKKLKSSLPSIKDTAELVKVVASTAKSMGLSFDSILKIFS